VPEVRRRRQFFQPHDGDARDPDALLSWRARARIRAGEKPCRSLLVVVAIAWQSFGNCSQATDQYLRRHWRRAPAQDVLAVWVRVADQGAPMSGVVPRPLKVLNDKQIIAVWKATVDWNIMVRARCPRHPTRKELNLVDFARRFLRISLGTESLPRPAHVKQTKPKRRRRTGPRIALRTS